MSGILSVSVQGGACWDWPQPPPGPLTGKKLGDDGPASGGNNSRSVTGVT